MKKLLTILCLILLSSYAFNVVAFESNLPGCPKKYDNSWNLCQGTHAVDGVGIFSGEYMNAQLNGLGRVEYETGVIFEGTFKNWQPEGFGNVKYTDGSEYTGEFFRGKAHGKGRMVFANGDIAEGEWVNNIIHGETKYIFTNGDIYQGEFHFGKQDGFGKYTWKDGGMIYEGEFINHVKSGRGKYFHKDFTYEGDFNADKLWGYGVVTYKDGSYYKGEFLNGYLHGEGQCYLPGKEVSPCKFIDGKNVTKQNPLGSLIGNIFSRVLINAIIN